MSYDLKLNNGDIPLTSSGTPEIVRDENKLTQDVLKMLFTPTGESKIHPWYGTPLLSRVIGNSFDLEILTSEVQSSVEYGINNLSTLQQLQQQDNQFLTPREQISEIKNIFVELDPDDPRKMIVRIEIISKSNNLITESIVVAV